MKKWIINIILFLLILQLINFNVSNFETKNEKNYENWTNEYKDSSNNPFLKKTYNKLKERKTFLLKNEIIASKAIIFNDTLYFITKNVSLFALDIKDLSFIKIPISSLNNELSATPAIATICGVIAVKDGNSFVKFFKIREKFVLEKIREYGPTETLKHSLIASENRFFVSSSLGAEGEFIIFNCDGKIEKIFSLSIFEYPGNSPAFVNDIIVMIIKPSTIYTKEINNKFSWKLNLRKEALNKPIIYKDKIIIKGKVKDTFKDLLSLDLKTGKILWKKDLLREILGQPIVYNDKITLLLENNTIVQLNITNGKTILLRKLPSQISFSNIKTDVIILDEIAIFTAKYENKSSIIYYDIINDIIKHETINKNIGKIIGLSLASGILFVVGENGVDFLPIYTRSKIKININPTYPIKINLAINSTIYTIYNKSKIEKVFLIKNNTKLFINSDKEIKISETKILKFVNWENVNENILTNATVIIKQWEIKEINLIYDFAYKSQIILKYQIVNSSLNIKPKLKINDTEKRKFFTYLRENEKAIIKIFAEPLIVYNETLNIAFQEWSDGVKENERYITLKSKDNIRLTAVYKLLTEFLLLIKVSPSKYLNKIFNNLDSSIKLVIKDDLVQAYLNENSKVNLKIINETIKIDNITRIIFLHWNISGKIFKEKEIEIFVDKNYIINLSFKVEWYYELEIINVTKFFNETKEIIKDKFVQGWSDKNLKINLTLIKTIKEKFNERITLRKLEISKNLNSKIIQENKDLIFIEIQLNKGKNKIILNYFQEKISILIIILPVRTEIKIENKTYIPELKGKIYQVTILDWISEEKNYKIEVPKEIKINEEKILEFIEIQGYSDKNLFNVKLKPGEIIVLNAIYKEKKIEIKKEKDLLASFLDFLSNNWLIILIIVIIIFFLIIITIRRIHMKRWYYYYY